MAGDVITVHIPIADITNSIEFIDITKKAVTQANGIEIKEALRNKNNSLQISIENTANADSTAVFKAGNAYPNAMLGDLTLELKQSAITVILLEDAFFAQGETRISESRHDDKAKPDRSGWLEREQKTREYQGLRTVTVQYILISAQALQAIYGLLLKEQGCKELYKRLNY